MTIRPSARFITSAVRPEQFPEPAAPEIAFIGRSNVGKSSLLNSLAGAKVAHVSSTPGRTQMINFFAVHFGKVQAAPDVIFADLPGYGYAKAPKDLVRGWGSFIDPYLSDRSSLRLCIALVDSNIPPQPSDLQMVEWLRHRSRPFQIVATKIDRLSGNARRQSLTALEKAFGAEPLLYSIKSGQGRDELLRLIRATVLSASE